MKRAIQYSMKGIGIVLFVWIVLNINFHQAISSVAQASPLLLLLSFSLFPAIYLLKAWRWHVLTGQYGITTTFQESAHVYIASLFLGISTPGRVGEAFKIPWLKRRGLPVKSCVMLIIIDRLFDVITIAILSITSLALLFGLHFALSGLAALILAGIGLLASRYLRPALTEYRSPASYNIKWVLPLIITLLNWAVYYFQMIILAQAFSLQIPALEFLASMTIAGVLSMLPIAPAGLGTRDAVLVYLFSNFSIEPAQTIAFSFSIFIITICASLIGAYFWLFSKFIHR